MKYFLFSFLIFSHLGFSNIATIHSFQEAEKALSDLSTKSLVLFDVDEVLITPCDMILKPIGARFKPKCFDTVLKDHLSEFISIMLAGTEYVLVDSTAPNTIKDLMNKGIPTIGLTSCRTGIFGVIESMENWRIKQLNELNIDFSSSFSKTREHSFPGLVDANSSPPLFKKGILFCGDFYNSTKSTKGELLSIFLDWKGYKPDIVIFFDDEINNLIAVQEETEKKEIPFKGFLFKKVTPNLHLDEKIAELQFRTVLEKKKWLSDTQAKKALSKQM